MTTADEYVLDTPVVRSFIVRVRTALAGSRPGAALQHLRPAFAGLLADPGWLPAAYRRPSSAGTMGGGIASWLLFRAGDGGLSLFSLVVPAGAATPVHDHLAWGLVGLYQGEQDEEVFRRCPDAASAPGALELVSRQPLRPGDFYVLEPPEGDIHRVRTTSAVPSVSIHLLGNDTGCVWRHAYEPDDGSVRPFRSGWSNVPCRDESAARTAEGSQPAGPGSGVRQG
jgi:predicted metal-dependent enzyme (double-stranded beta helix superfamily)